MDRSLSLVRADSAEHAPLEQRPLPPECHGQKRYFHSHVSFPNTVTISLDEPQLVSLPVCSNSGAISRGPPKKDSVLRLVVILHLPRKRTTEWSSSVASLRRLLKWRVFRTHPQSSFDARVQWPACNISFETTSRGHFQPRQMIRAEPCQRCNVKDPDIQIGSADG